MASLMDSVARAVPAGNAGYGSRSPYEIRRVGVLGAGTMGARIAAHVANAGVPVVLLDVASETGDRNGLAMRAVEALKSSKPAAFADAGAARLIATGNFEDDLERLRECDWIVEAVAEKLEIKRALLARVVPHLKPDAILSTNTSGLPVHTIAEGLPGQVRTRWMGTHFFNPPRYMRLVEVIASSGDGPCGAEGGE